MDNPRPIIDLRRTFAMPHELTRSRPRDVRLTAGGKALYVTALVLVAAAFVGGGGVFLEASRQAGRWAAFDRDSVEVRGAVTRLWRGDGDEKPAWVAYRFEASGFEHHGESRVRTSYWRTLEAGATVEVRYLPDDPLQSVVVGAPRKVLPVWVAFLLALALGGGGAACFAGLNRERRLLMEGRAAPALVTSVVKHKTQHGGSYQSIEYTFRLLSGAIAKGKSGASSKPPIAGGVICVVYDPDRPARSRPYPFSLVRL